MTEQAHELHPGAGESEERADERGRRDDEAGKQGTGQQGTGQQGTGQQGTGQQGTGQQGAGQRGAGQDDEAGQQGTERDDAPEQQRGDADEATGVPAADAAAERLRDLDHAPVDEHVAIYEDAHRRLQEGLADLDER